MEREQLEEKQIAYMRGKIAEHDVRDDQNNLIVPKGQTITDELINKAKGKGKLHYLMLSAAASVIQSSGPETERRMQEFKDVTEGHEADLVRGEPARRDVTDFQGNVIVQQGETVNDKIIAKAQDEGVLQELVLAVAASGAQEEEVGPERPAEKMGYRPYA